MTTSEVEIVGPSEVISKEQVVATMAKNGLTASVISDVTGLPTSVVRSIVRKRTVNIIAEDPEIAEAWKKIEVEAIDLVRRTLRFGSQQDRMSLLKIITGRALARRTTESSEQIEEMRMAWDEIRDEQRDIPELRSTQDEWDADEDEDSA